MIDKIVRTNGKELEIENPIDENGNLSETIPNHAYIYFYCSNCGKYDKKQKRRFSNPPQFLCRECQKSFTINEKYGVSHASQATEVKKKIGESSRKNNNIERMSSTLKEKYGVENASQISFVTDKKKKTRIINLLPLLDKKLKENEIEPLFDIDSYIGQRIEDENVLYSFRCLRCGEVFKGTMNGHFPKCPSCFKRGSKPENEIVDFIKELYNGTIIQNTKNILPNRLELDIYLPEKKLAIEFNGLYWHSLKDKYYHLNKTKEAEKKGIKLLHIFEDEWEDKKSIVKNIIRFQLGLIKKLPARKTIFKEINSNVAKAFFEEYHIQGSISSSLYFGLFYEGELVAALSMQNPRYNSFYDWEIGRVAYKYHIIGGLSKLVSNFRKYYKGSIITYSDRRLFSGGGYKKAGFSFLHETDVNYFYTDGKNRYSRVKFQKHKLSQILEYFDENKTEKENMLKNGYLILYDCGNFAYALG